MTEYEYEYYSAAQKGPNTNTNIIRLHQKGQNTNIIRIPKNTKRRKVKKCKQCEYAVLHA